MSPGVGLALLAWGTLVGLDLVSVPQMMIARPFVAGGVAGLLVGDPVAGLLLGVLFELFQLDILPVGAVRYPEYGPAAVAAAGAAHMLEGTPGLGLGVIIGLVTALVGGLSLHVLRRVNGRLIHAAALRLEAGDPAVLVRLHVAAIGRDALRATLVTGTGLALAWALVRLFSGAFSLVEMTRFGTALAAAAVAAALAAAASGTLRAIGTGPTLRWFALGLLGGAAMVWLA